MRGLIIAATAACALLVTAAALGGGSGGAVFIQLKTQHHSGITGTATLTPKGKSFTVKLVLQGSKAKLANDYLAHIHNVTCAKYAAIQGVNAQYATVKTTLTPVSHGTSDSAVAGPLAADLTGGLSINVHKATGVFPTILCGDLPKR